MIYLFAYIATIFAANWLVVNIGIVPVGFGLVAPAAVYAVGLAFTLRDLTQEALGTKWVFGAIVIGAVLSGVLSPAIAIASGAAFLFSETADLLVYTPLRKRNWYGAVVLSNLVGMVVDSYIFLTLAFGGLDFLAGQVVGKAWMTVLAIVVLTFVRRWQRASRAGSLRGTEA